MKYSFFLFLFLFFYSAFSQDNDSIPKNEYFDVMDEKLSVKLDVDNDIEVLNALENGIEFEIKPNIDYRAEIAVHYRFISFKLGFTPHLFTNFDQANKGKTKTFNFETDIYIKKWIQTIGYKQTKGFYSPNYPIPEDYPTDFLILDQLKIIKFKGATRYRFNPNYSLLAITTQTEIQRKSAGTFMPSLAYSFQIIDNKATGQKLRTINTTLGVGYLHTFVINKKLYASLGATPGVGIDFNRITVSETESNDTNYTLSIDGHLGLGYNTNNWFGGGFFKMSSTNRKDNEIVNFNNLRTHFQVFIGYRFNAPKFLKKEVDWIEDKSPFDKKESP